MNGNTQSRKWMITINNPIDAGYTHEVIIAILALMSITYYCLADEIGEVGTFHTHIFVFSPSPIRFSTIKNKFPVAHLDKVEGSAKEVRSYIEKGGKWLFTEKAVTSVIGSFVEWGTFPTEQEEKAPELYHIAQMFREGKTIAEVIEQHPKYMLRIRELEGLRQTILADRYASENRYIDVSYLYGTTGAGKTRSIYAENDPREICRITNYREGKGVSFDSYSGQNILVFEEFHSQIPIGEMLNYLDIYPLSLPARYTDRVACYTKVYITSNLPLDEQYLIEQHNKPGAWAAFLRRIHHAVEFREDGTTIERKGFFDD